MERNYYMELNKKMTAGTVINFKAHKKYSTNLFGLSRRQWSDIIDRVENAITDVLVVTTFGILPFVGLFLAWFGRCL